MNIAPRQLVPSSEPVEPHVSQATRSITRIASNALFNGSKEVQIVHDGAVYRLKQTSLGKLILTK